jgi:GAF domain-containing protein
MLNDDRLIGAIVIYRQEVLPFTDKQIELVKNFAAQAVIAIENTRLLNELRQRTDDLSEALEQQTATSEVLRVISSSPGELEPVFQAMLENATRFCEAKFGIIWLCEGDEFRCGGLHNAPPALAESRRREPVIRPHAESPLGRAARTKQVVYIADVTAEQPYAGGNRLVEFGGARTILAVPMLKDNELIGVITIYRQEVRPFTDKCAANRGVVFQRDGDLFRFGSSYGFSPEAEQYALEHPLQAGRDSVIGRAALEGKTIHIPDVLADPEYKATGYQKAFGYRTSVCLCCVERR